MDKIFNKSIKGNNVMHSNYSEILTEAPRTTSTTIPSTKTTLRIKRTTKPVRTTPVVRSTKGKRTSVPRTKTTVNPIPRTTWPKVSLTSTPTTLKLKPSTAPSIRPTHRERGGDHNEVPLEIYIGAAVGGAVLISLIIVIIVCCLKRRRKNTTNKRKKPIFETSTNGLAMMYRASSTSSEHVVLVSDSPRTSNQLRACDHGIDNRATAPSPLLILCDHRTSKRTERKIRNGSNTDSLSPSSPETRGENAYKFPAPTLAKTTVSEIATNENDPTYENGYVLPDFGLSEGHEKSQALVNPNTKSQTLGTDRPQPQNAPAEEENRQSLSQLLKWIPTPRVIHGADEAGLYVPMGASSQSSTNANSPLNVRGTSRKTSLPAGHLATPPKPCGSSEGSSYVNVKGKELSSPTSTEDEPIATYEAIFLAPEKTSTPATKVRDDKSPQEVESTDNYENINNANAKTEKHSYLEPTTAEETCNSPYVTPSEKRDSVSRDEMIDSVYHTPMQSPVFNKTGNECAGSVYETPTLTTDLNRKENYLTDSLYEARTRTIALNNGEIKLTNSLYVTPTQTPELNRRESDGTLEHMGTSNEEEDHIYPNVMAQPTAKRNSQENTVVATKETLEYPDKHVDEERHDEDYLNISIGNDESENSDTENVYHVPSSSMKQFTPEVCHGNGRAKMDRRAKLQELRSSQTESVNTTNVYENTVSTSMEPGQSTFGAEENPGATYMNTSPLSDVTDNSQNGVYEVPGLVFNIDPVPLNSPILMKERNNTIDKCSSSHNEKSTSEVGSEDAVKSESELPDIDTENVYDIPQSMTEAVHKDERRVKPKPAIAPKPKPKMSAAKNLNQSVSKVIATPITPQPAQSQINGLESTVHKAKAMTFSGLETVSENPQTTALRPSSESNSSKNSTQLLKDALDKPNGKRGSSKTLGTVIYKNDDDDDDDADDDSDGDTKGHPYVNVKDVLSQADPCVAPSINPDRRSASANANRTTSRAIPRLQSVDRDRRNDVGVIESPTSPNDSPVSTGKQALVGMGDSTNTSGKFDMKELKMALRSVRDRKS